MLNYVFSVSNIASCQAFLWLIIFFKQHTTCCFIPHLKSHIRILFAKWAKLPYLPLAFLLAPRNNIFPGEASDTLEVAKYTLLEKMVP